MKAGGSRSTANYSLLTANSTVATPVSPAFLIRHSTFSIQHWTYTFSAKEKDSETGLSYFGSRYYSSDLSVWLSVDPQASKYPSLSPYTYCANNPVRVVDPDGEEIVEDKPPGKISNFLTNLDRKVVGTSENRQFEGGSDGANQGTMTKQDVEVGVAVGAAMMSVVTALEATSAVVTSIAAVSAANSVDDATVNSSGQTAAQRDSVNNPTVNTTVNKTKQVISIVSTGHSGSQAASAVKAALKNGKKEIQKVATRVAQTAVGLYGTIKSFIKRNSHEKRE